MKKRYPGPNCDQAIETVEKTTMAWDEVAKIFYFIFSFVPRG